MPTIECPKHARELRPAALAEVLSALALVDRVEDQRRHAVEGQQGAHRLVFRHGPWRRIAWPQGTSTPGYGGLKLPGSGRNRQRRHVVLRLALEDDLLHAVAVAGNRAGDLRLQRRSLGQAADGLEEILPGLLLIGGDLARAFSAFRSPPSSARRPDPLAASDSGASCRRATPPSIFSGGTFKSSPRKAGATFRSRRIATIFSMRRVMG